MKNVTVKDILTAADGSLLSGDPEAKILHLTTDSRVIPEEAVFVPIVGENINGHDYIEKALLGGAKATLTAETEAFEHWSDNHPEDERTFILVKDTTDAIQKIGRMARTHLSIPAIGVTGSVGKTTTREMIACALSAGKKVYKTDKNFNNWLGVPITLAEMTDEDDIAVLELGLNVRGELGLISSLANIETAVITNIGVSHIEFYGTQDEIAKEKFTITKGFWPENPAPKRLFLNGNDPFLNKYKDSCGYAYTTYGTTPDSEYYAAEIRIEDGRYAFDLVRRGEKLFRMSLSVLGEHNVLNAVGALAIADYYGVELAAAAEKLSQFTGFKNRLQRIEHDGYLIIDDSYNASPASMKAGLDVLESISYGNGSGKRIAVLGDMFELGEFAPQYHYEVGTHAAVKKIDELFLIGENAMEIKRAVEEAGSGIRVFACTERADIVKALKKELRPDDIVYIKASHGMKLQEVTEGLTHEQ